MDVIHEEFCDGDHSIFDKCNTYGYKENIGYCQGCGRYGIAGRICIRKSPDSNEMEECGEYL